MIFNFKEESAKGAFQKPPPLESTLNLKVAPHMDKSCGSVYIYRHSNATTKFERANLLARRFSSATSDVERGIFRRKAA